MNSARKVHSESSAILGIEARMGGDNCKTRADEVQRKTELNPTNSGIQSWASVVTGNKMASRGMNLQFIVPMIHEGEKIVQLDPEDIENEKWSSAIVLYVIVESPTIGAMERFLVSQ